MPAKHTSNAAKAASDQAATWAAKCAVEKQQYPSHTLCYLVSSGAICHPVGQAPPSSSQGVKMKKQLEENSDNLEGNSESVTTALTHQ